ncbi:MADS-box transcription factor 58-like [Miscanthus floridulus]|uniref:MADS-box transcription factor 58-like n=1 Tax=Miscanthus floridulus TaxID=154761 RepID=UPI0034593E53
MREKPVAGAGAVWERGLRLAWACRRSEACGWRERGVGTGPMAGAGAVPAAGVGTVPVAGFRPHYKQESARLRQQITNLQNSNRALIGDSITTMSHKDLKHLETRLDKGLGKIRARKNEVLCSELEYMQRREMELQNDNLYLRSRVEENERAQQTVNMMGAPSTSEYQQQGFIPYDPIRSFLEFNIMQKPQFYSQQEDRKDFNLENMSP